MTERTRCHGADVRFDGTTWRTTVEWSAEVPPSRAVPDVVRRQRTDHVALTFYAATPRALRRLIAATRTEYELP